MKQDKMKKLRIIEIGANLWSIFSDDIKSAKYRKHYSDDSFLDKLKSVAKVAGMKVVYPALLLQYLMKSNDCFANPFFYFYRLI